MSETADDIMKAAHLAALIAQEADCWDVIDVLDPHNGGSFNYRNFASVHRFVCRLGVFETLEAAKLAEIRVPPGAGRFRYFCGVCWRKIDAADDEVRRA